MRLILTLTVFAALFFLFQINRMTYALIVTREISEEKQPRVYKTVNLLILALMILFYLQVYYNI
ncbi:hypothetical protein [Savagea faecisuis]|uniref:Uncharacterized protein n=1 Tax=Savagea faecisuis TaxID=1274803 RepID=A0ABW3GZ49_9BACL